MRKKRAAKEKEKDEEENKENHPGPGDERCGHQRLETGLAAPWQGLSIRIPGLYTKH